MLGSDGHIGGLRTHPQTPQSARLIATTVSVAVRFVDRPRRAETLRDLPKKPVPKISTRSRSGAAAPAPRPPSALPCRLRGPPVQARQDLAPPERAAHIPQERDEVNKKWPKHHRNPYENAAAPPSASRRKLAPRSRGELQDQGPRATARGTRKNGPSSSSRRPGSPMLINHVYRDYGKSVPRPPKDERDYE